MDFMNLNQAAHGDREFGYIQSRLGVARKTVAGHVDSPVVVSRVAAWARAAVGREELRHLRLARFGDNMRDVAVTEGDKVEAQLRFGVSVNTYGVNDLVAVVDDVAADDIDKLVTEYADTYRVAPELLPRRRAARVAALRRPHRAGAAHLPRGRRASPRSRPTSRTSAACASCPGLAVQRLMADGYGFGGEGDWKTSVLLRGMKVMADGLPGGTSFMEDYTYHLVPGEEKILGAHMLEVCPTITDAQPSLEIHPLGIGGREDPVRLRFTADPGPGVVAGLSDLGDRFRLTVNEIDVVEPDEELPKLPVACAVWEPRPSLATSAEAWLMAGAPHHTVLSKAIGVEVLEDFAEMTGTELVVIDADTTPRSVQRELRWNAAYHRLAQGL